MVWVTEYVAVRDGLAVGGGFVIVLLTVWELVERAEELTDFDLRADTLNDGVTEEVLDTVDVAVWVILLYIVRVKRDEDDIVLREVPVLEWLEDLDEVPLTELDLDRDELEEIVYVFKTDFV